MPVDSNNTELKFLGIFYSMHVMVLTCVKPKKGYLNFTLGNLWATQPIALLIWPPLVMVMVLSVVMGNKHWKS